MDVVAECGAVLQNMLSGLRFLIDTARFPFRMAICRWVQRGGPRFDGCSDSAGQHAKSL